VLIACLERYEAFHYNLLTSIAQINEEAKNRDEIKWTARNKASGRLSLFPQFGTINDLPEDIKRYKHITGSENIICAGNIT
jgi:hypothetical protein